MRHRISLQDLLVLLVGLVVAVYLAFEFDFYVLDGAVVPAHKTVELDEALSVGGLAAIGMIIFCLRRYLEQKRETARRIAAEREVRTLAFQDGLTGLANRRQLENALDVAFATPVASGSTHAVLMLDLNGFKSINDEVLIRVAQRLLAAVSGDHLVSRLGGDEFVVLVRHAAGPEAVANVARRVIETLEKPMDVMSTRRSVSTGIGIALVPADGDSRSEILRKADVALYRAKSERRGAMRFFEAGMDQQLRERDELEHDLRSAVDAGDIALDYRPEVDFETGRTTSFEAVAQWRHAKLGPIDSARLVAIAEGCGLVHTMSESLLVEACRTAAAWPAEVALSFPIAPILLRDPDLQRRVLDCLAGTGFEASRLELAIPESAVVSNLDAARQALSGLREIGVKITLDKFGTGCSSLYHLRNFGVDKIKIDRSFIASRNSSASSARIVNALVGLGHGLGLAVKADKDELILVHVKPSLLPAPEPV